jgi:hypothetical protein
MHEILVLDMRHGYEPYGGDFELFDFFFRVNSPEISLPAAPPALGLGTIGDAPLLATA